MRTNLSFTSVQRSEQHAVHHWPFTNASTDVIDAVQMHTQGVECHIILMNPQVTVS